MQPPPGQLPHPTLLCLHAPQNQLPSHAHVIPLILSCLPKQLVGGAWVATDGGIVGKAAHVGPRALSFRVWAQGHEGCPTPTPTHLAKVFGKVQHPTVQKTEPHKVLVVGPSEGPPPMLRHCKLMGKGLAECGSKHFGKALLKNPYKKQSLGLTCTAPLWGWHDAWRPRITPFPHPARMPLGSSGVGARSCRGMPSPTVPQHAASLAKCCSAGGARWLAATKKVMKQASCLLTIGRGGHCLLV